MAKVNVDEPFSVYVKTLSTEQQLGLTDDEWRNMFDEMEPTEIQHVLVDLPYEVVLHISTLYSIDELADFLDGLTEEDWESMSPAEWRTWINVLPATDFKDILDEMSHEEIIYVWQFFNDAESDAFFDEIVESEGFDDFTVAEWQAAFDLPATEFKERFYDKMESLDEILDVSDLFSEAQIDRFLDELTIEDWESMTTFEYQAVLSTFEDRDDLIKFIH